MANPIDLEKLCQGAKAWNAWREKNPNAVPDLTDANLTLSQRQLGPASGGPINLRGANLAGATLRYATLSGADLADAVLAGADLVHARLDGADLAGADLTDAICDNADLAGARLDDAVLSGASFANVHNLTEDQISLAYGDSSTLLPAAIMPPAAWFPEFDDSVFPEYPVPEQMTDEDLYTLLGVARTATQETIRTAFRILVKKLHPDVNPDDDEAQEAFKKVSIAYRILSDADKRARYDKGEIGSDGEISPEFEAKRQFRRYAFRFYAAGVMALLFAAGVLGVVWHAVLTDERPGNGRVEIAVATPPKSTERLDTAPSDLKVDFRKQPRMGIAGSDEGATAAKTELMAPPSQANTPSNDAPGASAPAPKAENDAGQPANTQLDSNRGTAAVESAQGKRKVEAFGKQASLQAAPDAEDLPESRAAERPADGVSGAETFPVHAKREADPALQTAPAGQIGADRPQATQTEENRAVSSEPTPAAANTPVIPPPDGQSAAPASASPPPAADAAPVAVQSEPPHEKVTTRPLSEEHKGEQPRPAQADAARTGAPAVEAAAPPALGGSGIPLADRIQPLRNDAFIPKAEARKGARDAISTLFRQHAVKQALARAQQQATASVDPLASREEPEGQEEIRDVYTHSLPDEGAAPARAWPGFPETKRRGRREVRPATRDINAKVPAPENHPAAAATANRKQAVSDILAGGF